MIAIVDYGAGNLRSVANALKYLGANSVTVSTPDQMAHAEKIILPGVGAFGAGMQALRDSGFEQPIKEAVAAGTPLLGICLGMQYLFETSYEMGEYKGLGLLAGRVLKFPESELRVPHIGWNQFEFKQENPLLKDVPVEAYAYFVHSYYVEAGDEADILATTHYGLEYASIVARANVYGIQCHPEKSQGIGLQILKNFVEEI